MLPEARASNISGLTRICQPAFLSILPLRLLVTGLGGHKGPIFKLPDGGGPAAAAAAEA